MLGVIALAILFETGPSLQQYLFGIGSASRPSLYAAVYGDDPIQFFTFSRWVFNADSIEFLIVSFMVYIYSDDSQNSTKYVIRFTAASFAIITAFDTVNLGLQQNAKDIWQNLIGNLIGPPILAICFIVIARLSQFVQAQVDSRHHQVSLGVIMVFISAIVSGVLFLLARTLFAPLPSEVNLSAGGDVAIAYARKSADTKDQSDDAATHPIAPRNLGTSAFAARGSSVKAIWNAQSSPFRRDITGTFYAGCSFDELKKIAPKAPVILAKQVSDFAIDFPGAYVETEFVPVNDYSATYRLSDKPSWAMLSKNGDKIDFGHTWWDGSQVQLHADGEYRLLLDIPFSISKRPGAKLAPRIVRWSAGGRHQDFEFRADSDVTPTSHVKCLPITSAKQVVGRSVQVLITAKPSPLREFVAEADKSSLIISGDNGWFSFLSVEPNRFALTNIAPLSFVGVTPAKKLTVDTQVVSLLPSNDAWIKGDLRAKFSDSGDLLVEGTGETIWLDWRRINKTLWERVPNEWAIYVTGLLLVGIGVIFRTVRKVMAGSWNVIPSKCLRPSIEPRITGL